MRKQSKAPIVHISKRSALPWYGAWAIRGAAILLALVVCAFVTTALTGEDPIGVYKTMFAGAFGTKRKAWILGQNLAILLCVSLAVTPAFKMRFWNIGGEGQAHRRSCHRCLHDPAGGQNPQLAADYDYDSDQHRSGGHLGRHPRHL